MLSLLVCGVLGVAAAYAAYRVVYTLFLWPRWLSPLRALPGPPLGNPLTGQSAAVVLNESGTAHREWAEKYGPVVRVVGPLGMESVFFLRPEALQQILVKDWIEYPRPTFKRRLLALVAGEGILTAVGNDHRQIRRVINPAFSLQNLMAQTAMYKEPIQGLIEVIKSELSVENDGFSCGKVIPVYDWMSKVTLDIICEAAFGYRTDSLHNPHNPLAEAYEQLLGLQSGPTLAKLVAILSLPGGLGVRFFSSNLAYRCRHVLAKLPVVSCLGLLIDAMHRIKEISREMLKEKMAVADSVNNDFEAKKDIMSILVRARMSDMAGGKGEFALTDKAMVDQVLTFLGPGHETTASSLTWTLWHLAKNPAIQDRLREEITASFSDNPFPDYRDLKELQWLDSVLMESLRIMPPIPLMLRIAARTDYVDGVLVPEGTIIQIPIRAVNTWKEIWGEDAEEYKPERWLNLPATYNATYSSLSFSAGPQACIGKTMALIEMKMVLAHLIYNFAFEPVHPGQVIKPATAITIKPTDGMPLRVRKISHVSHLTCPKLD